MSDFYYDFLDKTVEGIVLIRIRNEQGLMSETSTVLQRVGCIVCHAKYGLLEKLILNMTKNSRSLKAESFT